MKKNGLTSSDWTLVLKFVKIFNRDANAEQKKKLMEMIK
jgi:hypothetical protein